MRKHYDIGIIGAGPAGTSCALALRNSGLKVALIDKSKFPRDFSAAYNSAYFSDDAVSTQKILKLN